MVFWKTKTLKCARWALGLSCETPAASRGLHTTENSKRAHLSAPALQTPPKFHEKNPREGRKERILRRERGKKARNFGPSTLRTPTVPASTFGPTLRASTFSGLGPPPFWPGPHSSGHNPCGPPPFGPPLYLGPWGPTLSTHPRQLDTHTKNMNN